MQLIAILYIYRFASLKIFFFNIRIKNFNFNHFQYDRKNHIIAILKGDYFIKDIFKCKN